MNSYAEYLLDRFRRKGVLVDTNLLLLLLVGSYNLGIIRETKFKRVANYSIEDFQLLLQFVRQFTKSVTTPHILTEVSNLAGQLPDQYKTGCFRQFVDTFRSFVELESQSAVAAARSEFPYLGLTDCVVAEFATDYLVLTDDLRFHAALNRAGLEALNFNHIRILAW